MVVFGLGYIWVKGHMHSSLVHILWQQIMLLFCWTLFLIFCSVFEVEILLRMAELKMKSMLTVLPDRLGVKKDELVKIAQQKGRHYLEVNCTY